MERAWPSRRWPAATMDRPSLRPSAGLFNQKLEEWEDYYNYHRPHGALDGQTPYERLMAKARAGVSPTS